MPSWNGVESKGKNMKHTLLATCLLACGLASAQTFLSQDGKSDYVIAVPETPSLVIQTAANELQSHLFKVTGSKLPIISNSQRPQGKPALVIGIDKPGFEFAGSPQDTIGIQFEGKDILLNGHPRRGSLYAVYTFLEDYVGIRWWTPEESFIPKKPTLSVEARNLKYTPAIRSRETFYRGAFDEIFAPRLKNNGHFERIQPEMGGHMSIIGWCHTAYQFLPPDKYFNEHPDWYSLENGKRRYERHQLCLTNEEMTKEFIRVVMSRIRNAPDAGIISVSQNDWHGRCQCPACLAVEEEEGSQAGPLIRFVNKVAAAVEKEYPDFLVETLAYQYTRQAPKKTKPAKNVVIRLCSIEMNYAQALATGPANVSFKKDIDDWSAIATNLYIWNYVTNFSNYMLPQPNWRNLGNDIRFFVKHNAIGIFEQGDSGCNVGDFVRARQWIIAHMLWNPELDQRALMEEFFNGYYGAAGPHLLSYIDWLCDLVEKADHNLRCYSTSAMPWFPNNKIPEAIQRYRKAEDAVADDPVLAARVRRERLSLDLVCLMAGRSLIQRARFHNKDISGYFPEEPLELAKNFDALCKKYNVGNIREGGVFGDYGKNLIDEIEMALDDKGVPEMCKGLPPETWMHFNARFYYIHGRNRWAFSEKDPKASVGTAIRMPENHTQWATQFVIDNDFEEGQKWRATVKVRFDGEASDIKVLEFGVYNNDAKKDQLRMVFTAKQIAGTDYATITTEPFTIYKNCYGWFAPFPQDIPQNGNVPNVYIDSVTLIKEP